jgi:hypothetical protein
MTDPEKPKQVTLAELATPALIRAAARAYELSLQTKTPFVVWRDGKIIDLITNTELNISSSESSGK